MVERRQETQRLLSGRNSANPIEMTSDFALAPRAALNVPGVQSAQGVNVSATDNVLGALAEWGSKKIREKAKTRYEAQMLDGAMAQQQGQALEDIDPGDNGWALEGYRVMDAQTAASSLLAAQQQEIEQGAYELDPEGYRSLMVSRLEKVLDGKDERTQDLIKRQMAEQMPTLIASQVSRNMQYKEERSYESLVNSIDVVSKDPSSVNSLLAFADGGAGSTGLSTDRRKQALVEGIARAYELDNPLAYSTLKAAGKLDDLTVDQMRALESAQAGFKTRRLNEYDEARFAQEQDFLGRVEKGEYIDPNDAVRDLATMYSDWGIDISAPEARAVLGEAKQSGAQHAEATNYGIQTAKLEKNWNKVAELTAPYIMHIESGGRRDAVSPTGAKSEMQVMDGTNADPGFGVAPARDGSLAERARVGHDYWRAMVNRYDGDLEAAGIAYNAGPKRADDFLAAGRDYSAIPAGATRDQAIGYVKKLNGLIGGEQFISESVRAQRAQSTYEEAKDRAAIDIYAVTQPMKAELDRQRIDGTISQKDYDAGYARLDAQYGVAVTKADIDHKISVQDQAIAKQQAEVEAAKTAAKTAGDKATAERAELNLQNFQLGKGELDAKLKEATDRIIALPKGEGVEESGFLNAQRWALEAAGEEYRVAVADLAAKNGVPLVQSDRVSAADKVVKTLQEAQVRQEKASKERVQIERALATGTGDSLSPDLQQKAWDTAKSQIMTKVQADVNARRITPEQGQDMIEAESVKFFTKSGFVPKEVRNAASATLGRPLVNEKGQVDAGAIATIQEYATLRGNNLTSATDYLTPEARVVADAALSLSGGNPRLIPGALETLWAQGMSTSFSGKPDPDFMSKPETRQALGGAIKKAGIFGTEWFAGKNQRRVKGMQEPVRMTPEIESGISGMVANKVLEMHRANPRIAPQHLVDAALEATMSSTAIIGNEIVMDPYGNDLYKGVFGSQDANRYRSDPAAIGAAVDSFVMSGELEAEYAQGVDLSPVAGFWDWVGQAAAFSGAVGFSDTETQKRIWNATTGTPVYTARVVGEDRLLLDFDLGPDQPPMSVVVPLSAVGDHYKRTTKQQLTK